MAIESYNANQAPQAHNVVHPVVEANEEVVENVLRPKTFDEYIGQGAVKENLLVFTQAAKERGESLDHTLLYGPPGLGKTTLCMILASAMGANLRQTAGPALDKPGDLAAILTNLQEGDFLFIDEIHRLKRTVEEVLYTAMEDYAIDLVVGKGPSARTMRLAVPRFTLVGATTLASRLSGPLRDRFGHIEKLRYYEPDEMQQIIMRSAHKLGIQIQKDAAAELASCARRTPRIGNRLIRRVRDFAQVGQGKNIIDRQTVQRSLKALHIDSRGLNYADQQYIRALCDTFHGGPVGLTTLAAAIGEDTSTIEDMMEPFLIREGLVQRTPRGRCATQSAYQHMGLTPPEDSFTGGLFA